jgi:Flp pilus assembly protein TadB
MEQKVTASKNRIIHAQRKEMRKLKWKLIMGMFKRKSKDKGSAGITILAILALVLIVGGLIALTGWKIALFFLVGVPLLYLLLRNKK